MIPLELLLEATAGQLWAPSRTEQFSAFATDSREVQPGECFVAVRGVHADGHDFVADAVAHGAAGVLMAADRLQEDPAHWSHLAASGVAIMAVADVRLALRHYAGAVLRRWGPRVIAVAGSAGKTTTKEALAEVLGTTFATFRSWRNYNDLLGLPLSLGRLEPQHEVAVLELSCDFPGEIAELAAIVRPEIAIVLNAAATHLDGLGSVEGVAAALAALPAALPPTGIAVLNRDDRLVRELGQHLADRPDAPRIIWFGADEPAAPDISTSPAADPPHVVIKLANGDAMDLPHLFGQHWRDMLLATLATATALGVAPRRLPTVQPLPGRMRILEGQAGMRLLDDSHSAIPAAMHAALTVLGEQRQCTGRAAIALLGDMTHLGAATAAAHHAIGLYVPQVADWLITRGPLAEEMAQAARAAGMAADHVIITHTTEDGAQMVRHIAADLAHPPIVLIKGSPEMRMEQAVASLLADAERGPALLDRQRMVWQRAIVGTPDRPTWLEIDLGAIGANCQQIADLVGSRVAVMATLKADAYGHGAVKVAHTVLRHGATWLGVATASEAAPLRAASINAPILVYGYLPPWQAHQAVQLDLRTTVYDRETATALDRAAQSLGRRARVHIKIDTGMGRLGLRAEEPGVIAAFVVELRQFPGLEIEGLYTHFATADDLDLSFAREQIRRFHAVIDALPWCPPIIHAANSAATLRLPEAWFDLVRPGIALYGLHPSAEAPLPAAFRPAMTFKTQIALVKTVPAGEGISYGHTYVTTAPERLATLPVGYADGFRRGPANWGTVLIRGQRAPIRGRVCMDQTIVSVDHIPEARAGDEVVLLGRQGGVELPAEDIAHQLGTGNYEVVAALLARVPRVTG